MPAQVKPPPQLELAGTTKARRARPWDSTMRLEWRRVATREHPEAPAKVHLRTHWTRHGRTVVVQVWHEGGELRVAARRVGDFYALALLRMPGTERRRRLPLRVAAEAFEAFLLSHGRTKT